MTKQEQTVVLLHGIWMKSIVMQPLARQLRQAGYKTRCYSYPALFRTPAENARVFSDYINDIDTDRLHFVAHSLGGIVLMHYFDQFQPAVDGRVVMLGSPLAGSENAHKINELMFSSLMLGRSVEEGLLGDVPEWHGDRELGMIAGSKSMGVGNLLGRSKETSDGAVLLSETWIDGISDHITLPVSHSGMLISARVAEQVIHFLEKGHFLLQI